MSLELIFSELAHYWQWVSLFAVAMVALLAEWCLRKRNTAWARILPPLGAVLVLLGLQILSRSLAWPGQGMLRAGVILAATLLVSRVLVYVLRQTFEAQHSTGAALFASFERAIAWLLWGGAALIVTGAGATLWHWAQSLELAVGRGTINLAEVVSALMATAMTVLAALWLAAVIERRLATVGSLEPNTKVVLGRLVTAVLLSAGLVTALAVSGIDLTLFSVLFGALGVGLGFGLQKIAASYVSGYIVLLDKGIKIGDIITVDKYYGRVTHIHARYTVIRTFDSTEALIPNELIVGSPIVNHSYSSSAVKITLPVTVGYDSDVDRVMQRLEYHASQHPRVVAAPSPSVILHNFAADGLAFELIFWIADPENGRLGVRSDIARAVWADFKQLGITLPYPQQVVHTA
jgi:small-conductance mechanosensitive channel